MNSFRAVYRALQFEVARQAQLAEDGVTLVQETRGWSEEPGRDLLHAQQGARPRLPLLP